MAQMIDRIEMCAISEHLHIFFVGGIYLTALKSVGSQCRPDYK